MAKDFLDNHMDSYLTDKEGDEKDKPKVKTYVATDDQKNVYLGDMINYSIANGGSPLTSKEGRLMFQYARDVYGDDAAHKLLNSVIIFNSRNDEKNKSKEDRIRTFYEMIHQPELEGIKNKLMHIGEGPVSQFHSTPYYETQLMQGNDPLNTGGMASK